MKLFNKIKYEDGKRVYYILGMKILTYHKNIEAKKNHETTIVTHDVFEMYDVVGENNRLIFIENGTEKEADWHKMEWLNIRIVGNNNVIKIVYPPFKGLNSPHLTITIEGNDNYCFFDKDVKGNIAVTCLEDNNVFEVGECTDIGSVCVALHGNVCKIGKHCMFSSDIEIWTDGHSVIDAETKELLNLPKTPVLIGDHCWIGRQAVFTKNAQIPNDCIVGIRSVVTKPFSKEHSIIAGSPARQVKTGISWNGLRPTVYQKKVKAGNIKTFSRK